MEKGTAAALAILSVVIPFAGGLSLLVPVPMGLLGYRYRIRVLLAATFAASVPERTRQKPSSTVSAAKDLCTSFSETSGLPGYRVEA